MAQDLTRGRPFPVLLRFALPAIGGSLFQLFYTLADTVIVGRTLGADALAAVGATNTVIYFVLCFIQGMTGGFGICMGQRCGAGDLRGMKKSAAAAWTLSAILTLVLTIAGCALCRPSLSWMRTPDEIMDMANDYMFVVLLGTGTTVFYNLISNLLRALGDSRTPLVFLVLCSLLNVALDIVFIVPLRMGVAGAAWATVLSQLLAFLLSTLVGVRRFEALRLRRADFFRLGHAARVNLKVGFPMGLQMSVMCIGQLAIQVAINSLGPAAIAGSTAGAKVNQFADLVDNAFGIAISAFVAQNYGAGRPDRIRSGVRAGLLQTGAANVAMGALIIVLRGAAASWFVSDPSADITAYTADFLLAVAVCYPLLGVLQTFRSSIQSMGNGAVPFAACIVELLMRLLAAAVLVPRIGYAGVCLAHPLAWIGAVALLTPSYFFVIRRRTAEAAQAKE